MDDKRDIQYINITSHAGMPIKPLNKDSVIGCHAAEIDDSGGLLFELSKACTRKKSQSRAA